ncbi:MAG: thiamine-phosphate kinase, partial [Planctomycetota bacterium]
IPANHQLVSTSDQIIDRVDFLLDQHEPARIGHKALCINLSDIAAMGATPHHAIVTLSLPERNATQTAAAVYEGILTAAQQYGVSIAGGDISVYDGPLAISVTLNGFVPTGKAWLRSGAMDGDEILVTGPLGGSLLGRHLDVVPRCDLVARIRDQISVNAAMDISDGLSLDLDRLCAASSIGALLDVDAIPIHDDAVSRARETGKTPIAHALSDGEDFELLLVVSPDTAQQLMHMDLGTTLSRIGTCTGRTGLWQKTADGKLHRMTASGYIHGSDRSRNDW